MSVGNLKIHQWVIYKHPKIVSHYIQYDNENPLDTLKLNCAVDNYKNMKDTYGNITDLVVYKINYFHPNSTKRIQIKFGFCKEVAVKSINYIPTLKQWKNSISSGVIVLPHPFFKHNIFLFINLLTLGSLSAPHFTINNSSDLER